MDGTLSAVFFSEFRQIGYRDENETETITNKITGYNT